MMDGEQDLVLPTTDLAIPADAVPDLARPKEDRRITFRVGAFNLLSVWLALQLAISGVGQRVARDTFAALRVDPCLPTRHALSDVMAALCAGERCESCHRPIPHWRRQHFSQIGGDLLATRTKLGRVGFRAVLTLLDSRYVKIAAQRIIVAFDRFLSDYFIKNQILVKLLA